MLKKIPFNKPKLFKNKNLHNSLSFAYNGYYSKLSQSYLQKNLKCKKVLLTSSCTGALEIMAMSLNLKKNDEVIMPSYTFVGTANAFLRTGAKLVFCDIDNQLVIDYRQILNKINKRTKAIVVVNYNGNTIDIELLKKKISKDIFIVEDAAQSIFSKYKKKYLGTFGDLGCISFHETKNLHCGVGGALLINNLKLKNKVLKIWNRGTNKDEFDKNIVKKYQWVELGASFYISEFQSQVLYTQLLNNKIIKKKRKLIFKTYCKILKNNKHFSLPIINNLSDPNYHIFYIILKNFNDRNKLISYLKNRGIQATSHYEPLHKSIFYKKHFRNIVLKNTESYAKKILRLPIYFDLKIRDIKKISYLINNFFS